MMPSPPILVAVGSWDLLQQDASAVREAVFVREQAVPLELEYDDADAQSIHAVAYDALGIPLGTGRLLPDGHIGRMAVHEYARGQGIGGRILDTLIEQAHARRQFTLVLHAQTPAAAFYATRGFRVEGDEFLEAGIAHVLMRRVYKKRAR